MNETVPETLTVLPNPMLFRAARWMQRVAIGVAAIAVLLGLAPLAGIGANGTALPIGRGALPLVITGLWCAISLFVSEPERQGTAFAYVRRIAKILALLAAAAVMLWIRIAISGADHANVLFPPVRLSIAFLALTVAVVLLDHRNWLLDLLVDVLACGLCLLVLLILSEAPFGRFALFGRDAASQTSAAVLVCFIALTVALTLRQAEHGVFSIFLGAGMGSRLARIFAPVLIVLPFAWEAMNARVSRGAPLAHLGAAMSASAAVAVAVGILLFFTWRINRMENEIHDLVLRDEASRLYNHRGFHMLAEHALKLAQRSGVPFSVLFIDLENLAEIHASLGSSAAAASLAEAGEILRATFRESDIKGRIGAAEFAVAGQFDRAGISIAAMRLEAATAARIAKHPGPVPLKFCMGHVTTSDANENETLKDMLRRAGQLRFQQTAQFAEMRVN